MLSGGLKRETQDIRNQYRKNNRKNLFLIIVSIFVLIGLSLLSLKLGVAKVSLSQTGQSLIDIVFNRGLERLSLEQKIIFLLRLPRIVLAILAGAALSVSGVVMQGLTRNPLVSPFTIGISSSAAFGASIAIVFTFTLFPGTMGGVVINAFIFSLLCAFIVYGISWKLGMSPETLILTGIALNYLFAAMTSVVKYVAEEHQLAAVINWTFGSLNNASWNQNLFLAIILFSSIPILLRFTLSFNALTGGGDELAQTLGINPLYVKIITGIIAVILTASTISFTGVIGFVGLGGPHIARLIVGGDHRHLIPFSLFSGAILVLISDTLGRTLLSPVIIPVGIVISFLGVPLFLSLIITRRRRSFS